MNSNELCTFQKRLLIIVPAYELLLHFRTDVRYQSVCHRNHSWCWSTLHAQSTLQWLQLSCSLQPNVRVSYQNDLVYLHPLPSAGAIEWRQFCWMLLHKRVPFHHTDQHNQRALLLATCFQQDWRHLHTLHDGSVERDHHRFLWKKQLNQNSLTFAKHSVTPLNQLLSFKRWWKLK